MPKKTSTQTDVHPNSGALRALASLLIQMADQGDPVERAKQAQPLIAEAQSLVARTYRQGVYEATRERGSYDTVAAALGISRASVNLAVTNHLKSQEA